MKAMIISDFLAIKSAAGPLILVAVTITLFTALIGGPIASIACLGAMIPAMYLFAEQAIDDTQNWSGFRLTLPLSRAKIVCGRYSTVLLFMLIGLGLGALGGLLMMGLASLIPSDTAIPLLDKLTQTFSGTVSPSELGMTVLSTLIFTLVGSALTLPFVLRYGLTRASRLIPVALCFIFLLLYFALPDFLDTNGLLSAVDAVSLTSPMTMIAILLGLTLAAFGFYALSAWMAVKLYTKREF